jgi:glutamine synthetase
MFEFDELHQPVWKLRGKDLLQGETDGSSYPNGGMRVTHTAGGYLTIDPKSPIFLRGDAIFLPACFVSYKGQALDEKTPLHRATQAMSKQGKRLFGQMGVETSGLVCNIGLEQELFFVPRDAYYKRTDLQLCGRTVIGKSAARGQEGCTVLGSVHHIWVLEDGDGCHDCCWLEASVRSCDPSIMPLALPSLPPSLTDAPPFMASPY